MIMSEEMRKTFGDTLAEMMAKDDRIVVIDSDLSKPNGTYPIGSKFPERMFNVGVAEANMASIGAGLASYGFIPFITTFAPFATRRICDQVTISIAYAKQNVKIVGTDPGIVAELNDGTHMGVDDIGIMRGIPGMVVYKPVDNTQLKQALPQIVAYDGPVYIRMFRKVIADIFMDQQYKFDFFKADKLRDGSDVSLFCTGIEVKAALDAADILERKGITADVINIHTIKPIDTDTILSSIRKTNCAVTCENHGMYNGLGSAIMEIACEHHRIPVMRIAFEDRFCEVGKLDYLVKALKLTPDDIVSKAENVIAAK